MTDENRNQQGGAPSADPIQQGAAAQESPATDQAAKKDIIDSIMAKKWGPEYAKSFSENCPQVYNMVIQEISAELDNVFKDLQKPMHQHTRHIIIRVSRRMAEISISRALIAHLINHIQGIDENEKNFYTEFQSVFDYIHKEISKRPEAPGYMDRGPQQIDVFFDAIGKEDAEAVTNGTFNTVCAEVLRDAAANETAEAVISAQQAGRNQRRQLRENAIKIGAIMGLQTGNLVTFSERDLWDAFAPGKISKIGTLAQDEIDNETGQVTKDILEKGEIMPVSAIEVSYKALFLLNTILANSVENYRERFVKDGAITFYVKGVLDQLEIDPRIKDDGQLDINRKTAGVIYLEKQFVPLLQFIGTIPGGSRYSVFSYDGYDADTDTMTVRIPYLFQLWTRTQKAFAQRKTEKQKRIDEGKRPLKKDLKPLEVNALFKPTAFKEEDTVLEIAAYITNVMLNAGAGAHKTDITFKTLIKNCPRLRERLDAIERIPKGALQENGKRINKTARYNSELRKIARAYSLIMNADKCDAVRYFSFDSFMPTKENGHSREFIPPTKSTIDGKISIKWHKTDPEN